jgi:hypothetical protein
VETPEDAAKRTRQFHCVFPLIDRQLITSIKTESRRKLLVALAKHEKVGKSACSWALFTQRDVPELARHDSKESRNAGLTRRLVWGSVVVFGGVSSHLGTCFFISHHRAQPKQTSSHQSQGSKLREVSASFWVSVGATAAP